MTMYYPTRDGYPSMFEDDAGALAAATPPMPENESRNSNSPGPLVSVADFFARSRRIAPAAEAECLLRDGSSQSGCASEHHGDGASGCGGFQFGREQLH
jgi:hypothetical protein